MASILAPGGGLAAAAAGERAMQPSQSSAAAGAAGAAPLLSSRGPAAFAVRRPCSSKVAASSSSSRLNGMISTQQRYATFGKRRNRQRGRAKRWSRGRKGLRMGEVTMTIDLLLRILAYSSVRAQICNRLHHTRLVPDDVFPLIANGEEKQPCMRSLSSLKERKRKTAFDRRRKKTG